jgi:hypothetical protein
MATYQKEAESMTQELNNLRQLQVEHEVLAKDVEYLLLNLQKERDEKVRIYTMDHLA